MREGRLKQGETRARRGQWRPRAQEWRLSLPKVPMEGRPGPGRGERLGDLGSPLTHPRMVNLTTASREPAALSSGWNSVSFAITFTPTILAGGPRHQRRQRAADAFAYLQSHRGKGAPSMHRSRSQAPLTRLASGGRGRRSVTPLPPPAAILL